LSADICSYCYSQIRVLSLPISEFFAIAAVALPFIASASTGAAYFTLTSQPQKTLFLVAIFAFQIIYETIIATLALTYMVPNCGIEERWKRLYMNKDADAIRTIQDRFDCCGFNTAVDRAWPFPHGRPEDGYGADQCVKIYRRDRACVGPWRQAEQKNASVFFALATVIFMIKVCRAFCLSLTKLHYTDGAFLHSQKPHSLVLIAIG
jgi:hypothetical protein